MEFFLPQRAQMHSKTHAKICPSVRWMLELCYVRLCAGCSCSLKLCCPEVDIWKDESAPSLSMLGLLDEKDLGTGKLVFARLNSDRSSFEVEEQIRALLQVPNILRPRSENLLFNFCCLVCSCLCRIACFFSARQSRFIFQLRLETTIK